MVLSRVELALAGAIFVILGGIVAGEISFAVWGWPEEWPAAAQATVVGAIVAFDGTLFSAVLKWLFDSISLRTTYRLNVRSSVLKGFQNYAANYLVPLSVAAGELASYLRQYLEAKQSPPDQPSNAIQKSEAAQRAFYFLARFVKYQGAVSCRFNIRGVDPSLGVFLGSTAAESRIWDVMLPCWAFGIWNLQDEATLVEALHGQSRSADEALAFLERIRQGDSEVNRLFKAFIDWLESSDLLEEVIIALTALNALINHEVGRVYGPWYSDTPIEPKDAIGAIEGLSQETQTKLGLFYQPPVLREDPIYPSLTYELHYPGKLSRCLIFGKWFLAIPHFVILVVLGLAMGVATFLAFFAIVFKRRYPRSLFDFAVYVNRWSANVTAYVAHLCDEYPPFSGKEGKYGPVDYRVEYPDKLNRWLPLVKWVLVLPHFIFMPILYLSAFVTWIVACFYILSTSRFPLGLFNFMFDVLRWNHRLNLYLGLLRDEYPPCRLR